MPSSSFIVFILPSFSLLITPFSSSFFRTLCIFTLSIPNSVPISLLRSACFKMPLCFIRVLIMLRSSLSRNLSVESMLWVYSFFS